MGSTVLRTTCNQLLTHGRTMSHERDPTPRPHSPKHGVAARPTSPDSPFAVAITSRSTLQQLRALMRALQAAHTFTKLTYASTVQQTSPSTYTMPLQRRVSQYTSRQTCTSTCTKPRADPTTCVQAYNSCPTTRRHDEYQSRASSARKALKRSAQPSKASQRRCNENSIVDVVNGA